MRDWTLVVKQRLAERNVDPTLHVYVVEELSSHLEERYHSLVSQGVGSAEAERSVLEELDGDDLERDLRRAERARNIQDGVLGAPAPASAWDSVWQDVRYAARALRKSPGFTSVAIVTLALGLGVNTAIFSVVNAVMLRSLPYATPERLVRIWESNPEGGWLEFATSHPNFLDWRAQASRWEYLAAFGAANFSMTSADAAEIVRGFSVTADFLPLLGVSPVLGRNFLPDEDRAGGNNRVAILSDAFWERRFGRDAAIVGQGITLNSQTFEVVGVLPPSFRWGADLDLLVPLAPDPARDRGDHRLSVIGKLRDGISLAEAEAELVTIAAALAATYPDSNRGWTVTLRSFDDWIVSDETRRSLSVLLIAVALVLAIACGNIANLLLARGASREKELSIRVALGAARGRIVRQLLTESVLLALTACVVGLALGRAATRLLVAFAPDTIPRLDEVSFDPAVVAFATGAALLSAIVFGLVPALQTSRPATADALRDASRGSTQRGGQRLRAGLIVAEVAISVALLIGAGLLMRSFVQLQVVEAGFDITPLMTVRITLPQTTYNTGAQRIAFYAQLLDEIRAMPGITGAATSSIVPLEGGNTSTEVRLLHRAGSPAQTLSADWRLVSPGYFATMGIRLRGRDFTPADNAEARRVIVSETFAHRYFGDDDPTGRTVVLRSFGEEPQTIIGVAADVRSFGLETTPEPMVYGSAFAYGGWNPMSVVWRSATDPASHVSAVRAAVRRLDPTVPLYDVRSLPELLADSFGPRRFNMYLLGTFAAVAVALAAIGLFGVMAYVVAQRTREIGVRLALGAKRGEVFRLVVGRGLMLTCAGAALGLIGAVWLARAMESLLFSVSATDALTFIAVPLATIAVALIACYVPARRAMQVDPVTALRAE